MRIAARSNDSCGKSFVDSVLLHPQLLNAELVFEMSTILQYDYKYKKAVELIDAAFVHPDTSPLLFARLLSRKASLREGSARHRYFGKHAIESLVQLWTDAVRAFEVRHVRIDLDEDSARASLSSIIAEKGTDVQPAISQYEDTVARLNMLSKGEGNVMDSQIDGNALKELLELLAGWRSDLVDLLSCRGIRNLDTQKFPWAPKSNIFDQGTS